MTPDEKLNICKKTRQIAAKSLVKVLKEILENDSDVSEARFRDLWAEELNLNPQIYPGGWYNPPPSGIGILFGKDSESPNRITYKSLRPQDLWPNENIKLDREKGIAYLFASPVNQDTGIIGDFGVTIYFGEDPKMKKHLIDVFKITKRIFDYAQTGMKFCEIAMYFSNLCKENNLVNLVTSTTDPIGTNIGHTIPSIDKDWNLEEQEVFRSKDWSLVCKMISEKRIFVNEIKEEILQPGMAITIEPRLQSALDPTLPMVSFHTIGLFYTNGRKELITEYEKVFRQAGMSYLRD